MFPFPIPWRGVMCWIDTKCFISVLHTLLISHNKHSMFASSYPLIPIISEERLHLLPPAFFIENPQTVRWWTSGNTAALERPLNRSLLQCIQDCWVIYNVLIKTDKNMVSLRTRRTWYVSLNPPGCYDILVGEEILIGRDSQSWYILAYLKGCVYAGPDIFLVSLCLTISPSPIDTSGSIPSSMTKPQNHSCMPRTFPGTAALGFKIEATNTRSTRLAKAMPSCWVMVTRSLCVIDLLSFSEPFLSSSQDYRSMICWTWKSWR